MAIYRFETLYAGSFTADYIIVGGCERNHYVNGCAVTKETHDRVLAELKANEAASGDDVWKPASEPPDTRRDVAVMCDGVVRVGYASYVGWCVYHSSNGAVKTDDVTSWHELPKPPLQTPAPEPPKEPEPVWQGPGWYGCKLFTDPTFIVGSKGRLKTVVGVRVLETELTRLIRLATDEELRHVCTHGTEPDSKPEVV